MGISELGGGARGTVHESRLFVPERFNRVELCGFLRRIKTKEYPYRHRENHGGHNGKWRNQHRPAESVSDHKRRSYTHQNANSSTEQAEYDGFNQELLLYIGFCGPNRHANTDFARALCD